MTNIKEAIKKGKYCRARIIAVGDQWKGFIEKEAFEVQHFEWVEVNRTPTGSLSFISKKTMEMFDNYEETCAKKEKAAKDANEAISKFAIENGWDLMDP